MAKLSDQRARLRRAIAGRTGRVRDAIRRAADRLGDGVGAARRRLEHVGTRTRLALGRRS